MHVFKIIEDGRRSNRDRAAQRGFVDGLSGNTPRPHGFFGQEVGIKDLFDPVIGSDRKSHYEMNHVLGTKFRQAKQAVQLQNNSSKSHQMQLIEEMLDSLFATVKGFDDDTDVFCEDLRKGSDTFYQGETDNINDKAKALLSAVNEANEGFHIAAQKLVELAEALAKFD